MSANRKTVTRSGRYSRDGAHQVVMSPGGAEIKGSLRNDSNSDVAWDSKGRSSSETSDVPAVADSGISKSCTILVADNHPVVREGLVSLINRRSDMRVIGEAGDGREAVKAFFAQRPDIVLLDLRMPIMDGIDAVTAICARDPEARVAIISSYQSEEDVYLALRAGAQGYILKDAPVEQLIECIHAVADGKTWIPPEVGATLAKRIADPELTRRENEVLHAVAAGKSNKEIGSQCDISEATVKVHMTHILEKLGVTGRTEAIRAAVKRGIVRMDNTAG